MASTMSRKEAGRNQRIEFAHRSKEDLYHRINVIDIALLPLRERQDDIEPLAMNFLGKYARRGEAALKGFEPEAMVALEMYPFCQGERDAGV